MSYIEIKKINGRLYKYERKSIRKDGQIKKVYVKYLGAVKPIYKNDKKK